MNNRSQTRKKQRGSLPGITKISVSGFKSLAKECAIEIRPLTILAGANSSGKSSIMQPLLLLKQTLQASYDPGPLLLDGPNIRFTSAEQFLSRLPGQDATATSRFTIMVEVEGSYSVKDIFSKRPKKAIELVSTTFKDGQHEYVLHGKLTHAELLGSYPRCKEFMKVLSDRLPLENDKEALAWKVIRTRCFFNLEIHRGGVTLWSMFPGTMPLQPSLPSEPYIRGLIHIPGLRGNPERIYKTTAIGPEFPGTFENYAASVVYHWQKSGDERLETLKDTLSTLGLSWKIEAKQVEDTQVELRVGRLAHSVQGGARDLVNIADVGFGVSQVLPVLVALLTAEPGQMVYLEQPEIHLHPRAQTALATALADAANRGVRVVAETHISV